MERAAVQREHALTHNWRGEFGGAFDGRTALVTGAAGFLGSHLCDALLSLGAHTHGMMHHVRRSIDHPRYVPWSVDVSDAEAVFEVIRQLRPQIVFHMAGLANASDDPSLIMPMLRTNVCGTVHLLTALAQFGCDRVTLACSAEEARHSSVETAVASPYGAAKTAASVYGRLFHRVYGVPVVLVRPILAYGPRQNSEKLIPHVVASLLKGETPLLSNGTRLCDFVYVTDVVRGFLKAVVSPRAVGATVDLGWGEAVTIRAVVEMLTKLTGAAARPHFGARRDRVEDPMGVADRAHAREVLGWDPLWPLEHGLRETIAWQARELRLAGVLQ